MKGLLRPVFLVVIAVAAIGCSETSPETADIGAQGGDGEPVAVDGATIVRGQDGIGFRMVMPTPAPESYIYPTADMMPAFGSAHPEVSVGGPEDPETFTLWFIVFNVPDQCTDNICNNDDIEPGMPARGGVYQGDGRIADGDELVFEGRIRLGQETITGAPLDDPMGAMIHLLIAPHGRALPGADGWRQLNGPIGNLSLWWLAEFPGR
jgi:hypothetical protein